MKEYEARLEELLKEADFEKVSEFIDEVSFDDGITNAEYEELYRKAIRPFQMSVE